MLRNGKRQSIESQVVGRGGDVHANHDTEVLRQLSGDGSEQSTHGATTGADVVPVEGNSEHAKTLVTRGTTEDTGEPGRVALGKTEDADTGEGTN